MRSILRLIAVTLLLLGSSPLTAAAQTTERCFPETGFCISGRIREFWEQNGDLTVFGFPITSQQTITVDGKEIQAQSFERNRLELHPENSRPYDVLLGRLGADRLTQQGRDWFAFSKSNVQTGCRFSLETEHNVCGAILTAWRTNGLEIDGRKGKTEAENLALFGMPLSDLVTETGADGKQYQMQWFERARFELHPENQAPYDVLLGLLGSEVKSANELITKNPVELVLRLEEMPAGFAIDEQGEVKPEDVAPNYGDPAVALLEFQNQGRLNSYSITFTRQASLSTLLTGPLVIRSQVIMYRDANGAKRGQEYSIQKDLNNGWQPISVRSLGDRTMATQHIYMVDDFEYAAFDVMIQRRNVVTTVSISGLRAGTAVEEAFRLAEIALKRLS